MNFIKKIPFPLSGLMLALFALANLLKMDNMIYFNTFSIVGIICFIAISLKIIMNIKEFLSELQHPIISSVLPTYSMSMMLMAAFLKPNLPVASSLIWFAGLVIHGLFMINYSYRFLVHFDLKKIYPSIFIVYVGIVVASVTGPVFNVFIGKMAFYFGFIAYILLLVPVFLRIIKYPDFPDQAKPTFAIIAAPASLCLAGYMSSFQIKNEIFIWFLLFLSLMMTLMVVIKLIKLIRLPFTPGFSAFTFPMVIGAIAIKKVYAFLPYEWIHMVVLFETMVAVCMVIFVSIKYILFLYEKNPLPHQQRA